MVTFLGMDVWLVTGDAEAREVLGDLTSYSTDVRPYCGKPGLDTRRHRRARLHRPAGAHPAAEAAHAGVHDAPARAGSKPAIDRIIEHQLDETERAAAERTASSTWCRPSRSRSRSW